MDEQQVIPENIDVFKMPAGIALKLLAIKNAVPYLKKDEISGEGTKFSYTYVSPENILSKFNPLFIEYKLQITPFIRYVRHKEFVVDTQKGPSPKLLHIIHMTIVIVDTDTGEEARIPWLAEGENGVDKGYGSALTYGLRYWFLHTFQIPTGEDDPDARKEQADAVNYHARLVEAKKKEIDMASNLDALGKLAKGLPEFARNNTLTEEEYASLKLAGNTRKLSLNKLIEDGKPNG